MKPEVVGEVHYGLLPNQYPPKWEAVLTLPHSEERFFGGSDVEAIKNAYASFETRIASGEIKPGVFLKVRHWIHSFVAGPFPRGAQ